MNNKYYKYVINSCYGLTGGYTLKHNPFMWNNSLPEIKKVIFNEPATIILWANGDKTVVKCTAGDTYDKEKGFIIAYLKYLLFNGNLLKKQIKEWVK